MASEPSANKLILSSISALLIGIFALILIGTDSIPYSIILIVVPIIAYLITLAISSIYQYSKCGKVEIGSIAVSDLAVFGSTSIMSLILFIESLPIKLWLFGPTEPVDECCGRPLDPGSKEYAEALVAGDHYKFQFFSGIVKAVIPNAMNSSLKSGFIAFYWYFFMSLLPTFFLLNLQGMC